MSVNSALIVAGGHGRRMGATSPKSLTRLGGQPILHHLLKMMRDEMIGQIVVSHDRDDFHEEIVEVADQFGAVVVRDEGYGSTVEVALQHSALMGERFLFGYGHALVDSGVLRSLTSGAAEATTFASSSRRQPIPLADRYMEPPFVVDREYLTRSQPEGWLDYWTRHTPRGGGECGTLPEPNTLLELANYRDTWSKKLRGD
ncbi:MobA-like NTP transferase domain-containing protein [Microbacterium sp. cf046]|uniref:NTP transferase domain-containing protein n=1 Tax=Microbacterium sp. cf046 TaxID=1761803 RepID=UPI0008EC619B|nr:NTP transferase domain-containing protein [Microbacterium sp. cf046]SFS17995.1 MobA-like NTP transferase domain-containing protein [Microbacterium sp. cf046]